MQPGCGKAHLSKSKPKEFRIRGGPTLDTRETERDGVVIIVELPDRYRPLLRLLLRVAPATPGSL